MATVLWCQTPSLATWCEFAFLPQHPHAQPKHPGTTKNTPSKPVCLWAGSGVWCLCQNPTVRLQRGWTLSFPRQVPLLPWEQDWGGNLCLMYPKLQSQTMRGEYMGNSMKNSGSWLQSPAEFRAQEEVEIPVQGFSCWVFFFFLCVFGWVFFCKSRAKVDGILGRDSGLPDPASFRLVRTGILWWRQDCVPTEGAAGGRNQTDVPYACCLPAAYPCVRLAHYGTEVMSVPVQGWPSLFLPLCIPSTLP